jgi:hypothetical protein
MTDYARADDLPPMDDYGDDPAATESDPIPFTGRRPTKPFPVDSLPAPIAAMVLALARSEPYPPLDRYPSPLPEGDRP